MQVFDDDHERSFAGELGQDSGERGVEAVTIDPDRRRVGRGDWKCRHAVGDARDVHEWTEWPARIDLGALAQEHERSRLTGFLSDTVHHCRLADASFAR